MSKRLTRKEFLASAAAVGVGATVGQSVLLPSAMAQHGLVKQDTLRWVAPNNFYVGSAVAGGGHHEDQDYPDPFIYDTEYRKLLATEFNSLTPENQFKWEFVHPGQGVYNFEQTDAILDFARRNNQEVRGHALLWHRQNPAWLERGDFTALQLREILREHIFTVVGRYAGRIYQWDVANEIFNDEDGNLRDEENIWIRELGPGIIADAFRWAHEADPNAKLFFNDYSVEGIDVKSTAYYDLTRRLLAEGVPVHGFSAQSHLSLQYGFDSSLQANLQRFAELDLETAITELDVRMPLQDGEPTPAQLERQAEYYQRTLEACLAVDGCNSFTIWGLPDKYSWVPYEFPGQGAATVLWDNFERKSSYYALRDTFLKSKPRG